MDNDRVVSSNILYKKTTDKMTPTNKTLFKNVSKHKDGAWRSTQERDCSYRVIEKKHKNS